MSDEQPSGGRLKRREISPRGLLPGAAVVMAGTLLVLAATLGGDARQAPVSDDIRMRLEGTWILEEWHHQGEVLRPPEVGGRWSNHDGVVMATFHRRSHGSFESFAGYGTYEIERDRWSYRYERVETARGTSPEDAVVTVQRDLSSRSFALSRSGDTVRLEAANDVREYDDSFFTYIVNGSVLRRYRKVR